MTALPDRPRVLRLAAPLVFSFWFRAAFQWVDTIYASTLDELGDASIAAIGLSAPFEFLMIACWVGLSNGLTSRLAAAMGAHEGARVDQLLAAARGLLRWVRAAFLLLAVGLFLGAGRVGLEPEVAAQLRVYGPILLGGSAFTAFASVIPDSLVKAHNDTRSTMWAGVISTLANFALNTLFVFAFGWGLAGIALATVLARLGGWAYAVRRAAHHEALRRATGEDTAPGLHARPARALLALSLPAGLGFALMAVEGLGLNALVASRGDAEAVLAALTVTDRAVRFLSMPVIALGVALLPLSARLWGARDGAALRREVRAALLAAAGYGLLLVVPLTRLLAPAVARGLTDAEAAREAAALGLGLAALPVLLGTPTLLLRSVFDGLQQPRPGLIASFLRTFALVLPLAMLGYLRGPELGLAPIEGLVLGSAAGAGVTSALLAALMRAHLRRELPVRA
jgi:Na+-driven multidrug efflux pump